MSPLKGNTKGVHLPPPQPLWESTATHHAPGFWDLLTKAGIRIRLDKRTLREFDRRNAIGAAKESSQRPPAQEYLPSDIKRYSRHADYSELRGFPEPVPTEMTPSGATTRSVSNKNERKPNNATRTTSRGTVPKSEITTLTASSAYRSDFMNLLISNDVHRPQRVIKPANYDQLCDRLAQSREGLSPTQFTQTDYEKFLAAVDNAHDEMQVMMYVLSALTGPTTYPSTANRLCNNWAPLTSAKLVIPKPDYFEGELQKSDDAVLLKTLNDLIVPSTCSDAPLLPNFLVEVKSPQGSIAVARRQVVYIGAFCARSMHHLQAYGGEEIYDGNAYTLSSTYTFGRLEIFAHHITQSDGPNKQPCYQTVSLCVAALDQDIHSFRKGVTAFRNARDLARGYRETFLADAHARMRLLPREVKDQKIAEAIARRKEVLDRNAIVDFSKPASNPELHSQLDSESSGESDATIIPAVQEGQQDVEEPRLPSKAGTKRKAKDEAKPSKGPKRGRKSRTT